jgi:DNA uptake protein ComE-like DNA-binding protein
LRSGTVTHVNVRKKSDVTTSLTGTRPVVDWSRTERADSGIITVNGDLRGAGGVGDAAADVRDGESQSLDIEALIEHKVNEAVTAALGRVQEQINGNTASLEDLRLVVRGVGSVLRDCVV